MSGPAGRRGDRLGRTPGFLFAACAVVLVVLVAAAFTPAQPPPPPTAEYAPAAVAPIRSAPPEQTSESGEDQGRGGRGAPGGSPSASPRASRPPSGGGPTTDKPVDPSKRCYGDPPRQTPDPQSPPCVFEDRGNPGATSRGVTEDEIRIAIPNNDQPQLTQALLTYFNGAFQTWRRKVVVETKAPGCWGGNPTSMRNTADSVAEAGVFAAVGFCDTKGTEYPFYDQLAKRGVVSVANRPGYATEKMLAAHHPYEWTWFPTFDLGQQHSGELACALSGRNASLAGPALRGTPRKYGVFYNTFTDAPQPDLSALRDTLAGCGIDADFAGVAIARDGGTMGQGYTNESVQQVNSAVLRMKNDDVTTVLLHTHADTTKQIAQVASGQNWQPELVTSSYLYSDFDLYVSSLPPDQQPQVFGPSVWNRFIHPRDEYWYQAIAEGDPDYDYPYGSFNYYTAWYIYKPLLVLFTGIQMAGPNLTPETFAAGLQGTSDVWRRVGATRYPNPSIPGHAEGKVTVRPGQHSYVADASVIWFDPDRPNPEYSTPGSFCYLDFGRRWALGTYTAGIEQKIRRKEPCGRYE